LDQTDLDGLPNLLRKGSGGRILKVEHDWWRSLGGCPYPSGGHPATEPDMLPIWSVAVDIWECKKEWIRKSTDIGEHFTREVIQSIVFIFLPRGEKVHLTNPVYYY